MIPFLNALCLTLAGAFASGEANEPKDTFAVKAAKVFTASDRGTIDRGMVWVVDGKIHQVGKASEMELPQDLEVIDLGNLWLVPGMHEPHSHVGAGRWDLHDYSFLTNPDLRTLDVLEPDHPALPTAVAGGVTSQLVISGSGNNMSGFGAIMKTANPTQPLSVDEILVRSPGTLKIAQAGNPERWGTLRPGRAMQNWNTRGTLMRSLKWARDYKAGKADFDPTYENFLYLEDGSIPVSVHTQIYQVVLMTITMQKRDLGLNVFIDHGTFDGYKNADLAAEYQVPVMNGPRQFWFDRSTSRVEGCAANWSKAVDKGLLLGYNTDSPNVPQEELFYQATMGVRLGHDDPEGALKGVTSHPAKAMAMDHISGSLEPGLEADFVAWTGFPLDPRSFVKRVWIRGTVVYDAERDGRRF